MADDLSSSESRDDLSEEELADLVVVAHAGSAPEAFFIMDALEAAGIPAVNDESSTLGITGRDGTCKIRVPRVRKEQAEAAITAARERSERRAIADAFTPESQEDAVVDSLDSPQLNEAFLSRDLEPEERDRRLRELVSQWLAANDHPTEIAKRLGLAGLEQDEAAQLVDEVADASIDAINSSRMWRRVFGAALALVGVVIVVGSSLQAIIVPFADWTICICIGVGLALVASAGGTLRRLPRASQSAGSSVSQTAVGDAEQKH